MSCGLELRSLFYPNDDATSRVYAEVNNLSLNEGLKSAAGHQRKNQERKIFLSRGVENENY